MKAPLVLIPGLGSDPRLFHPQLGHFRNSTAPPWIMPRKEEPLPLYARRWAEALGLKPGCALAGVSFGGMVALEMSRWTRPRAVFLIGSCRDPRGVRRGLLPAGLFPAWPWISKGFVRLFPPPGGWLLGAKTEGQKELLTRMFLETPDFFLRWTVRAIHRWKGYCAENPAIHHIHGERDRLIPLSNVRPDEVVQGGGHLISLSHPGAVNAFIDRYLY